MTLDVSRRASTPDHRADPVLLRATEADGRAAIQALLDDPAVEVLDTYTAQVEDLVRTRTPGQVLGPADLDAAVQAHLGGVPAAEHGVWVHHPWARRLVHLLDEDEFIELRTDRNRYKITGDEQRALAGRTVAVVGLSAGSAVAMAIALERSCGELRLADFDAVDLSNLNRLRCGVHELGVPKTVVAARAIAEIDPYLKVVCEPAGVTPETIDGFLAGADVVVEECDSIDVKLEVRLRARRLGIPVLMATSDSGSTDVERFDLEPDRPLFHGLIGDVDPAALAGLTTEEKIPYVVGILQVDRLSVRTRASLFEVDRTTRTWPQLASDVLLGGAVIADVSRRILLGEPVPSGRSFTRNVPVDEAAPAGPVLDATGAAPTPDRPAPVLPPDVEAILEAAVRAPSGGNAQPWRWHVDGDELTVAFDPDRVGSFLDFDSRASLLAIGASVENAVLAAHRRGRRARVDLLDGDHDGGAPVARITLDPADGGDEPSRFDHLVEAVASRAASRGRGPRQPLPAGVADALVDAVSSVEGARLTLLDDPAAMDAVGAIVGAGERLRMFDARMHRETFGELRFDRAGAEATRDGISLEELEANAADRTVLGLLRDRSVVDLLRAWGAGDALTGPAQRAVGGASALGLVTMPSRSRRDHLVGGRAVERAWLAATRLGIGFQPLAPVCYLFSRLADAPDTLELDLRSALRCLQPGFVEQFGESPDRGLVMLFRLAMVHRPPTRSLRRSLATVVAPS